MEVQAEIEEVVLRLPKTHRPFNAGLYGEMVRQGFSKLWEDEYLSDITLKLGDETVKAHRIVLSVWSDKFDISKSELALEVDPTDTKNFKLMLKHMYTGATEFITNENVMPLIRLCNEYGIDSLKEVCGELLGALVSDDNLFYFLDIVEKYRVKQLEAACGEHLADNFGTMLEEDKLNELPPSTWAEMLRSDDLQIRSEEQLFEAVIRYVNSKFKGDKEQREEALTTILPFVRFAFLSPKFLVKNVEGDKTIADLPIVHELLHETYRHKVYPNSVKTIRTRPRRGFIFDEENTAPGLTLSEDKTKVSLTTGGSWLNARALLPLSPDNPYCEFKIDYGSASQIMVGVVQGTCSLTGYAGQYANGWTYYSAGQIYHSSSTLTSQGPAYGTGDVIGCFMDYEKNVLTFYKNGVESCHADNMPTNLDDKNGLYPSVSINSSPNAVTLVGRPVIPDQLKAKLSTKKGVTLRSSSLKTKAPKTFSLGTELGGDDKVEVASKKPSDPTSFIKRFLKF